MENNSSMHSKSILAGSIGLLTLALSAHAADAVIHTLANSAGSRSPSTATKRGKPSYYRDARSYSTKRDLDPPKYTRNLSEIGIESFSALTCLDVGLDYRFRYEYRADDIRRATAVLDQPFLHRTRLYLGIRDALDPLRFAIELTDSRRYHSRFERDNRDVNEFELTTLCAELYFKGALGHDALGNDRPLSIRGGRMNFEFLDRRLLANNQWRNTPNTFQGFRITLGREENDWQLELLAVQPLARLKYDLDEPVANQWVYAAIGHWRRWSDIITLEPYYLGLQQSSGLGVIDREIHSAALRGYGVFGGSGFDYDFDVVYQFGHNGSERHRAFGATAEIGCTFDHPWKPRLSAFYGYASGDRDPMDNQSQRFERFFGFGRPWSANDYIVWENISTPKVRAEIQPGSKLRVDAGYSFYWLASDTDRFANANIRDRKGASGSFIGHEFDIRARYQLTPKVELTAGYAHFVPGNFTRNSGKPDDTDFAYLEITVNAF